MRYRANAGFQHSSRMVSWTRSTTPLVWGLPARMNRCRAPTRATAASNSAERNSDALSVMTFNASEFRSAEFEAAVARVGARHLFIRAGRPQTNGVVERVQETILDECWKPAFARYLIPKYTGLRLDLDRYLRYYNTDRAHTGRWTRGRTPEHVLGKVKMWSR